MPPSRFTYAWIVDGTPTTPARTTPGTALEARLRPLTDDRRASAEEQVRAVNEIVADWVEEKDRDWSWDDAARELEAGLAAWSVAHGWRGACALWLDALRRTWSWGARQTSSAQRSSAQQRVIPRAVFAEELGLWSQAGEEVREDHPEFGDWNGEPLAPGRRMPLVSRIARNAAEALEADETILTSGYSATLALALERADELGKRASLLVGESRADDGGLRMAERLSERGIAVTIVRDAALVEALPRADRVWLASEAIGAAQMYAPIGAAALVLEAEREGVPVQILASAATLVPGGELVAVPDDWCKSPEDARLARELPPHARFEDAVVEELALDLPLEFLTEIGFEEPHELALRALRLERAPRCGQDQRSNS